MKRLMISILLCAICIAAEADTNTNMKIGVVDIQKIMQSSPRVRAISQALQNQFKPREDKLKAEEQSIIDAVNKLKRNASVMTKEQIDEQKNEIADERNDFQAKQSQFMQDARAAQEKDLGGVIVQINSAVKKVAERGHYTLILQSDHAVYYQPDMDITADVLAAMK